MKRPILRASGNSILSVSTVLVITLVLIWLGMVTMVMLVGRDTQRHFREQLTVQILLKDQASESDIQAFRRALEGEDFSGEVQYISGEEAAAMMQKELGEDFVEFLGYNPLPATLDIRIDPAYSGLDTMDRVIASLEKNPLAQEVVFQKGLVREINENITRLTLAGTIITAVFLIVAVVLIVVTVWLAIFSQRFVIRSMQLVGATFWFIQKPFLARGLLYGVLASLLALATLSLLVYRFSAELGNVHEVVFDQQNFLLLSGVLVVTGVLVTWLSTALAVRRFVRIGQEKLY